MRKLSAIGIIAASLLASATSWWVSEAFFHRAPITTDEQSYLLQAELLSQGRVKYPPPPFVQPFRYPMVIVDAEQGWLSRYPPGHPLWLVPGVWMGEPYIMIALAAGIGVLLTGMLVHSLGGSVAVAILLLLISPYYIFTYGTMMSHASGFLAAAGMMLAYVSWHQGRQPVWALVAGLLWAWLFLNRTYTALLMAIPFAIDALLCLWRERRSASAWFGTAVFAGAACFGILLIILYNYWALGHPLRMTYLFYDPTDKLGFGLRHYWPVFPGPEPVMHTFAKATEDLKNNVLLLDQWLLGVRGGLVVWFFLALLGWSKRWSGLLLGSIAVVPLGYIFFWYPGWNETGPNYYFEIFPAIVAMAALGSARIHAWFGRYARWRNVAYVGLLLTIIWLVQPFISEQASYFHEQTAARSAAIETMRSAPAGSLVMLQQEVIQSAWPDHDLVFSPDGVEGDVIVARWMPSSNRALFRFFEDYDPLLLIKEDGGYGLRSIKEDAAPLDLTVPIGDWHRHTGSNRASTRRPGQVVRFAQPQDLPAALMFGRYFYLYPGKFVFECEVRASVEGAATLELTIQPGDRLLRSVTIPKDENWVMLQVELELEEFLMLEPRMMYHGMGEVEVAHMRLFERP